MSDSHDGNPKCGRYELLKPLEGASTLYQAGDVLEFNCNEAEFLTAVGYIGEQTDRDVTRKRLLVPPCAGCGATLVNDAAPAAPAAPTAKK